VSDGFLQRINTPQFEVLQVDPDDPDTSDEGLRVLMEQGQAAWEAWVAEQEAASASDIQNRTVLLIEEA
jgi:phage gp37-like protein